MATSAQHPNAYTVRNWADLYETHETRKLRRLSWVPVPNTHDGEGYRRLMQMRGAGNLFTAWVLILEVASRMPTRGVLADADGPLTAESLAYKTGFPVKHFQRALSVLSDAAMHIRWLAAPQSPAISRRAGTRRENLPDEGKGREGNLTHDVNAAGGVDNSCTTPASGTATAVSERDGKADGNGKRKPQHDPLRGYDWGNGTLDAVLAACPEPYRREMRGRTADLVGRNPALVVATSLDVAEARRRPRDVAEAMRRLFWRLDHSKTPSDGNYDRAKRLLRKAHG